jgi:ParB family chromosome partitioning protein
LSREDIPATIRELTDTQSLELQLIENLQRADVHELDEARGYAALMKLEPRTYTIETLAEKIGRSALRPPAPDASRRRSATSVLHREAFGRACV